MQDLDWEPAAEQRRAAAQQGGPRRAQTPQQQQQQQQLEQQGHSVNVMASPALPQPHPRRKRTQQAGARGSGGGGGVHKRSRLGLAPPYLDEQDLSRRAPYDTVPVPSAEPRPPAAAVQPHRAGNGGDAQYSRWAAEGIPAPVDEASAAAAADVASAGAAVSPNVPVCSAAAGAEVCHTLLQQPEQVSVSMSLDHAAHLPNGMGHAGAQQPPMQPGLQSAEPTAAARMGSR